MIEKIEAVTVNYKYYSGTDEYSDGNIEDEILEYVKETSDVMEILEKENRWPVLYHLSPVRQNIVEWYPMKDNATVLEVGAGCGAITGALCRKAEKVVANDLSKRRSLINANRNKQYSNLEIYVGNFNDLQLEEKFDYITLIGVLEYANYYTNTKTPYVDFLKHIKAMLKEDGKILIAIENKFGLKYWAGAREDHTGMYYDGIEGYHKTKSKVRTFSKEELLNLLKEAGYQNMEVYYPFPDYKFPVQIFSDDHLPQAEDLVQSGISYDNSRLFSFNENLVYDELIKEKKFDFFSNSFFVEASL